MPGGSEARVTPPPKPAHSLIIEGSSLLIKRGVVCFLSPVFGQYLKNVTKYLAMVREHSG